MLVLPPADADAADKLHATFSRLRDAVKDAGMNLIPESGIGLAVIKASRDPDLNPRRAPLVGPAAAAGTVQASQSSSRNGRRGAVLSFL